MGLVCLKTYDKGTRGGTQLARVWRTMSIVLFSALLVASNPASVTGASVAKQTPTRVWLDVGLGGNDVGGALVLEPNLFFEKFGFGFRVLMAGSGLVDPFGTKTSFASVYPTFGRGWRWETLFLMAEVGVGTASVSDGSTSDSGPAVLLQAKAFGNSPGKDTSGIGALVFAEATIEHVYRGAAFFLRF